MAESKHYCDKSKPWYNKYIAKDMEKKEEPKKVKPIKPVKQEDLFAKYKALNKSEQIKLIEAKTTMRIPRFEKGRVELIIELYH